MISGRKGAKLENLNLKATSVVSAAKTLKNPWKSISKKMEWILFPLCTRVLALKIETLLVSISPPFYGPTQPGHVPPSIEGL